MSKRIVLVDPLGDLLFSGVSLAAQDAAEAAMPVGQPAQVAVAEARDDEEIEPCPETLRSQAHDSGVFPIVKSIRPRVGGRGA